MLDKRAIGNAGCGGKYRGTSAKGSVDGIKAALTALGAHNSVDNAGKSLTSSTTWRATPLGGPAASSRVGTF